MSFTLLLYWSRGLHPRQPEYILRLARLYGKLSHWSRVGRGGGCRDVGAVQEEHGGLV